MEVDFQVVHDVVNESECSSTESGEDEENAVESLRSISFEKNEIKSIFMNCLSLSNTSLRYMVNDRGEDMFQCAECSGNDEAPVREQGSRSHQSLPLIFGSTASAPKFQKQG